MLKRILIVAAIIFNCNLYADEKYISWIDNLRIRENPSQSGKIISSLKKGEIVTSDTAVAEGNVEKIVLNKTDYYGNWRKIRTADNKEGWVFSAALKNYYSINGYSIYLDDNSIKFFKDNKQVSRIPVDKLTIDIDCDEAEKYLFLRPYEYLDEGEDGIFNQYTQVIIVDSETLKVVKSIDGRYENISLSPDSSAAFIQSDTIGISSPTLTRDGMIYSIKKNKVLFKGDYGVNGKWIDNDKFETIVKAGKNVKGMPDPGENYLYTEVILLDIKSEKIIHTGKYEKAIDD